ncbi:MAG: NAD-dependent epimerase/dehydratase family protein [Planctomycetota bacterium]|jgi:nucleoside-diphosphate-sugar epimerase
MNSCDRPEEKASAVQPPVVIITGAAGFLGSALTVDLARRHPVAALDRRLPSRALVESAPAVEWRQVDIADQSAVAVAFEHVKRHQGRIDFVLHFAAYYHFGSRWNADYEHTNVRGTANVLRAAEEAGARRLIFASSIAALAPPPPGDMLDGRSPTVDFLPYSKSKAIGERMVRGASDRLPSIVLRIGAAFSDWCELPPLHSLIRLWCGMTPLHKVVVGAGRTGFPYVHRDDFVRLIRRCIERDAQLDRHEVLMACQNGAVLHEDLFPIVRRAVTGRPADKPLSVPASLARIGVGMRLALGAVTGQMPYERPWMLRFVDRPWIVDATHTRDRLQWSCSDDLDVRSRLPRILQHRKRKRRQWERRNKLRNKGLYAYSTEPVVSAGR